MSGQNWTVNMSGQNWTINTLNPRMNECLKQNWKIKSCQNGTILNKKHSTLYVSRKRRTSHSHSMDLITPTTVLFYIWSETAISGQTRGATYQHVPRNLPEG